MAITISDLEFFDMGNRRVAKFHVSWGATNYTYGGEDLTPGNIRMTKIDIAFIECKQGLIFEYDYTEEKLLAFYPRGEVLSSLSAGIIPGETTVKSVADAGEIVTLSGQAGVAPGAATQVKGNVNLAEISQDVGNALRCMFIGY
jgi:hypothetical protein